MDLKIPYSKLKNKKDAYEIVKKNITAESIAKWKVTADLNYDDANHVISAKGKGFKLEISFHDDGAQVGTDLSLLLRPFKGKILEGLEKQLSRIV